MKQRTSVGLNRNAIDQMSQAAERLNNELVKEFRQEAFSVGIGLPYIYVFIHQRGATTQIRNAVHKLVPRDPNLCIPVHKWEKKWNMKVMYTGRPKPA